jgi:hypothetical protein
MNKIEEYCPKTTKPGGICSSVHYGNRTRFKKAIEQAELKIKKVQEIIDYTNEFLQLLGIKPVANPIVKRESFDNNFYELIKKENDLKDKRDIVWMKFTEDDFLGVVATSNDINFQIPSDPSKYNEKTDKNEWKYNTSGIIIHSLKKRWNENSVLVFPLNNIPDGAKRSDIERGVGDYLIKKEVPILDFFSHRY